MTPWALPALRVRWSWRDLRQRWVQVVAIALILAIGTGVYAALGSTADWRRASNDASFALTNLHDLKIRLSEGTSTPAGNLAAVAAGDPRRRLDHARGRAARLAHTGGGSRPHRAPCSSMACSSGTLPARHRSDGASRGGAVPTDPADGLLELNFARARNLPATGTLTVAGGTEVRYTGTALGPEYFYLVPTSGEVLDQGSLAVVFLPLDRAQHLAGLPGQVNDLVMTLSPSADPAAVKSQLEAGLAAASAQRHRDGG